MHNFPPVSCRSLPIPRIFRISELNAPQIPVACITIRLDSAPLVLVPNEVILSLARDHLKSDDILCVRAEPIRRGGGSYQRLCFHGRPRRVTRRWLEMTLTLPISHALSSLWAVRYYAKDSDEKSKWSIDRVESLHIISQRETYYDDFESSLKLAQ